MTRMAKWLLTLPVRADQAGLGGRRTQLRLEALEPREVPAAVPATAIGAAAGQRPEVRLLDAVGTQVRSFLAYDESFTGGVRTALADLDRDGVADVVTAPGPGGDSVVKVFSGATGGLLTSFTAYAGFTGGVTLAAGDIGTGERGVVTGADLGGGPHVKAFTAGGVLRREFFAYDPAFRGGVSVALGYADNGNAMIVTAPGDGGGPHVRLFEARSGADLGSFFAYDPAFRGGASVAAADLTGDGVSEVVTGAGVGGGPHVKCVRHAGA